MKKIILLLFSFLLINACASSYTFAPRYEEFLGDNKYELSFRGNSYTSEEKLKGFFDSFRGIEGLGSGDFLGSDDIKDFASDLEDALPGLQKEIPKLAHLFGASVEAVVEASPSMQVNELVANTLIIKAIERNAEGRVAAEGGGNVVSTNINAPSNSNSVVNTGTALRNNEAAAALANFR